MAYPFSTPSSEEPEEALTPPRSPSRLDFCTEDFEHSGPWNEPDHDDLVARLEEAAHKIGWVDTRSHKDHAYNVMHVELEDDEIEAVPLATSRLPLVEADDDCSEGDLNWSEDSSTSHTFPVPPETPLCESVTEPRAPIPVRPPSVQPHPDVQEPTQPSRVPVQRLNYPHHGFSRSAFLHQKSFWNSRHEEWVEWQTRKEQQEPPNSAYTGIVAAERRSSTSPPPYMRTPSSGLERDLQEHPPRRYEQDVLAPIYPRVGDISALRDPYSVNIDRCFCNFPLWTLHKTLYVFEMYQRSGPFPLSPSGITSTKVPESDSSSTLSSYTSTSAGDDEDSDDTLVSEDQSILKDESVPESCSRSPLSKSPSCEQLWGWQMSWYARWELLIGLVQRDRSQPHTPDVSTKAACPETEPVVPPAPISQSAGESGDGDSDEEDYGTLVPNPTFGADFEDGYERAIAFFGRESRHPREDS